MADAEIEMGQSGHDWFLRLLRLSHNFQRVFDNPCISRRNRDITAKTRCWIIGLFYSELIRYLARFRVRFYPGAFVNRAVIA